MPSPKEVKELSRALTKTLRHSAQSQGIPQDSNGWCKLEDLINFPKYNRLGASIELYETIVANDNKGRFELDETHTRIRAVQGHSHQVDVEMEELDASTIPSKVVHGTNLDAYRLIHTSGGLHKMNRLHIHLAIDLPGESGVISGMRASSPIRIWIDSRQALTDGIKFYRAKNGAILSPGNESGYIPTKYFICVLDNNGERLTAK